MSDLDHFLAFCPTKTRESVLSTVEEWWDWIGPRGGIFPVPRPREGWPVCQACGSGDWHYSHVSYGGGGRRRRITGDQNTSVLPYRAEPQLKCISCSAKLYFGIPITEQRHEAVMEAGKKVGKGSTWLWRDIRDFLKMEQG